VHLNVMVTTDATCNGIVLSNPSAMMPGGAVASRPTFTNYGIYFKRGGTYNKLGGGWEDPELARLYQTGQTAADPTTYWKQITARATTQADFLPVAVVPNVWYSSKKVQGVALTDARGQFPIPTEWSPK
jgi:ABC-type transport system substrate-binding protein